MKYRCHDCAFKAEYKFDVKHLTICMRNPSISIRQAVEECHKPERCPHYMTFKEVRRYMEVNNDT